MAEEVTEADKRGSGGKCLVAWRAGGLMRKLAVEGEMPSPLGLRLGQAVEWTPQGPAT